MVYIICLVLPQLEYPTGQLVLQPDILAFLFYLVPVLEPNLVGTEYFRGLLDAALFVDPDFAIK